MRATETERLIEGNYVMTTEGECGEDSVRKTDRRRLNAEDVSITEGGKLNEIN